MLNTFSAKLTAAPTQSGWAQVHEFAPDEPEKLHKRGRLFAIMATRRVEEGVETVQAGRELLSRLHEEYYGNLEASAFVALKSAVEKVIKEFESSWGNVEIAASSYVDDVVFSAAGGGGKIVISRDGAMATILESTGESVISASGYPKAGDVILIASKGFFEKVPIGVVKAGLTSESPEAGVEMFTPMVHGEGAIGSLGAIIIKFGQEPIFPAPEVAEQVVSPPKKEENFLASLGKKTSDLLTRISHKFPERRIYIKSEIQDEVVSQNKKLTFSVAIALLLILAVSIGFGVRQKKINDLKAKYQGILREATAEVDEAIGLASVSPDRARELFFSSEEKLREIEALSVKDTKVEDLKKKIDTSKGAILGEFDEPPELFLDLTLLSSGFNGDSLSSSGGTIFILDKSGKRIISADIDTKKSKVVAGPTTVDGADDLASYEDRVFVLANEGIYEVSGTKAKIIDKTWSGEALIHAFAGNIYVLDESGNAIYRFAGSGTTFSDKQNWLAAGTKVDFSDASMWAIDGSIYILFPNSKILKFSLGSPQNFSVSGVMPEIGKIDAIYADPDNQGVYLLDRAGKRVVVIDKKGNYKAQYKGDQIGDAINLVVSEVQKKIILLTGEKLLSIELKHL